MVMSGFMSEWGNGSVRNERRKEHGYARVGSFMFGRDENEEVMSESGCSRYVRFKTLQGERSAFYV